MKCRRLSGPRTGRKLFATMLALLLALGFFMLVGCSGGSDNGSADDDTTTTGTDTGTTTDDGTEDDADSPPDYAVLVDSTFDISLEMSEEIPTVATVTWSIEDVNTLDGAYIEFGPGEDFGSVAGEDVTDSGPYGTILLGMKPSREYYFQITAWVDDEIYVSDVQTLETGDAPSSLPALTATTYDAESHDHGFYVTSLYATSGAVILDEDGDYVWWYLVDETGISRASLSPDHQWVYMWSVNVQRGASLLSEYSHNLIKVSIDGLVTEEISLPEGHHDFVILPDGTIAYIEYDYRSVDSQFVSGDCIVEISPDDGATGIIYSVWDDFSYDGSDTDWCHANALDYDEDEDVYYMGSKNFSSILKIDRATGDLIYVIGGDGSDFTVSDAFQGQHQFQMKDGNLLVFDNGPIARNYSRGVEYVVDEDTMTLTPVWSYKSSPTLYNVTLGDAQFLSNGNRLITFSTSGQIDEVDSSGNLVWRLSASLGGALGYVTWKESLYE